MARAQGARALMALAFETTYGTPPVGGFTRMPFASTSLGAEQPLLNSELLGYGRDPLAPIKDAVTADGDVVVPLDAEAFGFWLKAAFGAPTTTGAEAPYSHEFQSGSWTLPSMSIETGMPEVPRYAMYSGCVLDQITWQMQRSGLLTATARLVAQGETVGTTTSAGTPAALELKRFGHFNGAITRNGSALGNVVSAEITYANNLDRIETIRSRRPHRRRRPVHRGADRPDRGALRRPDAGDAGDQRRGLRDGVRLRPALGRELHLHRARRLPAAPAHRDFRAAGRAGDLRLAGRARQRGRPDVHRNPDQRHRGILMLTLDLTNAPRWHDLAPGVRVQLRPLTTALMVATRSDPAVEAVPEEASDEERAVAFAKALARRAVLAWDGIGDADGNPIDPSPEAIDALLDVWPIFEAFQLTYVSKGLLLEQEKNASALSPNGPSAGATYCEVAKPAGCASLPRLPGAAEPTVNSEGWQVWDLVGRLGGQLRVLPGAVIGWDMSAALALGDALGVPPLAMAELLPVIEAVMVAKLNEQMDHSHG